MKCNFKINKSKVGHILYYGRNHIIDRNVLNLLVNHVKIISTDVGFIMENRTQILWIKTDMIYLQDMPQGHLNAPIIGVVLDTEQECNQFKDAAEKLIMWEILKK